jgi:hypothetical protein
VNTSDCTHIQRLLEDLVREHQVLLVLAQQQRDAMRQARGAEVEKLALLQQAALSRVATLESRRNELVMRLSRGMPAPVGGHPITLRQLCQAAPAAIREQLISLANTALELMQRVRAEHQALGRAAASLAAHMEGLTRQAAQAMSGTGIYGGSGRVRPGSVASGFDLRM